MKLINIIFLLFLTRLLFSQSDPGYEFYYDEAGNRTKIVCINISPLTGASMFNAESHTFITDINEKYDLPGSGTQVTVYPNPTHGELVIQISQQETLNGPVKAEIYNTSGKVLYSVMLYDEYTPVDLTGLSQGHYVVKLMFAEEEKIFKIIKE